MSCLKFDRVELMVIFFFYTQLDIPTTSRVLCQRRRRIVSARRLYNIYDRYIVFYILYLRLVVDL